MAQRVEHQVVDGKGMGMARGFGWLLVAASLLGILAGLGLAGYGFVDERENRDRLFADAERSDTNVAAIRLGVAVSLASLLVLAVGILLLKVAPQRKLYVIAVAAADAPALQGPLGKSRRP